MEAIVFAMKFFYHSCALGFGTLMLWFNSHADEELIKLFGVPKDMVNKIRWVFIALAIIMVTPAPTYLYRLLFVGFGV